MLNRVAAYGIQASQAGEREGKGGQLLHPLRNDLPLRVVAKQQGDLPKAGEGSLRTRFIIRRDSVVTRAGRLE